MSGDYFLGIPAFVGVRAGGQAAGLSSTTGYTATLA
jgi:hypothetical protein